VDARDKPGHDAGSGALKKDSAQAASSEEKRPMKLLRLAPENTKISFMRFRRISYPLSAVLSIIAVTLFFVVGMNFGIDFAGGTQVELRAHSGKADIAALRGKADTLGLGPVEAQRIGAESDVTLRVQVQPGGEAGQSAAVKKLHDTFDQDYEFRSVEAVGPRVSGELVQSGTLGVVVAILAVLTYLWFRFEWQFAVGAIIGTMHDLLLTVGFFAFTQLEFNQTSIAAILTIVGYSLNETVVVLDRIREVMRKYKKLSTPEIIDMSVNAVLPRTIMTATTVFLALLALFFLGGDVIRSFSAAMIWGIFVATYSSIFICSPMLIYMGVRAETFDRPAETTAPAKAPA
jgi:preprotein translocase subunit SecF